MTRQKSRKNHETLFTRQEFLVVAAIIFICVFLFSDKKKTSAASSFLCNIGIATVLRELKEITKDKERKRDGKKERERTTE